MPRRRGIERRSTLGAKMAGEFITAAASFGKRLRRAIHDSEALRFDSNANVEGAPRRLSAIRAMTVVGWPDLPNIFVAYISAQASACHCGHLSDLRKITSARLFTLRPPNRGGLLMARAAHRKTPAPSPSWPGLTRLRGRSQMRTQNSICFGEAKAWLSITGTQILGLDDRLGGRP